MKNSARDFYQSFQDTPESAIEYGCKFGSDKACFEAHPDYNALADDRKKLLSELDPVLEKQKRNSWPLIS